MIEHILVGNVIICVYFAVDLNLCLLLTFSRLPRGEFENMPTYVWLFDDQSILWSKNFVRYASWLEFDAI